MSVAHWAPRRISTSPVTGTVAHGPAPVRWPSRSWRHRKGEHPVGVDPRVHRARIQELLPLRAVAGDVDLQQGLPEAGVPLAGDVDRDGAPVDRDRQLLT